MSLFTSKVPRSLDLKTRLFGFELTDLLSIFLYLAMSNLLFGSTHLKFPLVWMGTVTLALVLYFIKRGKPNHYLQHLAEYRRMPSILSSSVPDTEFIPFAPSSSLAPPFSEE